jgi:hypothetical protein
MAILTLSLWSAPAAAQVTCGAKLKADTTLTATDPVVTGVCPFHGLGLAADFITLDCAGLTIKGSRAGKGLRLLPGTEGVTIQNCVVEGFATGIFLGAGGGAFVFNVVSQNNKNDGIATDSNFNFFVNVLSRGNGAAGFKLAGLGNGGEGAIALQNGKAGFQMAGREIDLSSSLSISNGAQGVVGSNVKESFFSLITSIANTGDGMTVAGGTVERPNSFGEIRAWANGGNGLLVPGTNPDANFDDGGNSGLANTGAIQCQIAGAPCAE